MKRYGDLCLSVSMFIVLSASDQLISTALPPIVIFHYPPPPFLLLNQPESLIMAPACKHCRPSIGQDGRLSLPRLAEEKQAWKKKEAGGYHSPRAVYNNTHIHTHTSRPSPSGHDEGLHNTNAHTDT